MGVMECNRYQCENILCGLYSSEYGHICDECYEELRSHIVVDIHRFMGSPKPNASALEAHRKMIDVLFGREDEE